MSDTKCTSHFKLVLCLTGIPSKDQPETYMQHVKALISIAYRCLAVDAPSPEDKLSWLSDIAQEHSVEWDAHAAALEMLPAERQSGFIPNLSGGPPGAGGGSSFGQGPPGGGHHQTQQRPPLQAAPANNAPFLPQPGPSASKRHQLLQNEAECSCSRPCPMLLTGLVYITTWT